MTAMVSATGGRTTNEYDAAGQLDCHDGRQRPAHQYAYDASGNRTRTTLPDGRQINYTYDALNRLTRDAVCRRQPAHDRLPARRPQGERDRPARRDHHLRLRRQGQLTSVVKRRGLRPPPTPTTRRAPRPRRPTPRATRCAGCTTCGAADLAHAARRRHRELRVRQRRPPDRARHLRRPAHHQHLRRAGPRAHAQHPATASAPARSISWTYDGEGRRLTQTESGTTSSQGTTTYRYDAQGRLVEQATPQGTWPGLRMTRPAA